jgi:glycine/D-amino acid oxidase-like deaminating enzyme
MARRGTVADPCPHGNGYDVNCRHCGALYLARREGREAERRDVVARLRSNTRQGGDDEHEQSCAEAEDIEAGEHIGAAAKEGE